MSTRGAVSIIVALFVGTAVLLLLLLMRNSPQFAPCRLDAEAVCKLVANVKRTKNYSGTYAITKNRKKLDYTWAVHNGNEQITGVSDKQEILDFRIVDDTLYLKDPAGEAWWEVLKTQIEGYSTYLPFQPDTWVPGFLQLVDSGQAKFTYLGEERCLDYICEKYSMVLPGDSEKQQHMLYIDNKEYHLRRYYGTDGVSFQEMTFVPTAEEIVKPQPRKAAPLGVNIFLEHNKKLDSMKKNQLQYLQQFEEDREQAEGSSPRPTSSDESP
ncbi:MAG: hypothetical protein ACEQSA_00390 [Weeksellaceae bacterium]